MNGFNTQNSLDSPLDKTTKAYTFIIIIIIIIIFIYAGCVMFSSLKLSNWPM